MTTKEVEVTTEQVESEEITFCDSCGADERETELLTLVKNPDARVECINRGLNNHVMATARPGSPPHGFGPLERAELTMEHDGQIDTCEDCLTMQYNADVSVDPFELEPRQAATQEPETDDDFRPVMGMFPPARSVFGYVKLALLWILFPAHMYMRMNLIDPVVMHESTTSKILSGLTAVCVWAVYVTYATLLF